MRVLLLVALLAVPAGIFAFRQFRSAWRAQRPLVTTTRVTTTLQSLDVTVRRDLLPPQPMRGGALERLGDGFLLVTASGEAWSVAVARGGSATVRRLSWRVPLPRERYLRDRSALRDSSTSPVFRVTDILLDTLARPAALYASHQHWDSELRCLTMRVSSTTLPVGEREIAPVWRTLFESSPCIAISERYDPYETGGGMAWIAPGTMLLTIGDHGFSGLSGDAALSQDRNSSYGKTIRIDVATGEATEYTKGHRNPQGLVVARDGRIWLAEHGPKGGDEINLLKQGSNYGWPLVTYGAAYNLERWPVGEKQENHGAFVEPAYVFMPSTALSNLIQLEGDAFPRWCGDLLVGTLKGKAIFRVRTRGDRAVYAERVLVGISVRDLAMGPRGEIVVYDGERSLATLAPVAPSAGETAFAQCATCHGADRRGTVAAPSLRLIYRRPIASHPDFAYSPALRAHRGTWTDEALDRFLRDPQAFAPGTSMATPGVHDAATRASIIGWLKSMDGVPPTEP